MSNVRRNLLLTIPALLAQACTPLRAFNALTPRDRGVRPSVRDVAYGVGPSRRLDIYVPAKAHDAPVLVFFFGGSWEGGRKEDYAFAGRAFAAKGFVTLVPNYRLTGEAPYPAFLEDCAAAVAWARNHARAYGGDPQRIVLVGHSAGAYNAAMLALDRRWLEQAGAPGAVAAWAGLSGPYDFLPLEDGPARRTFGGAKDLPATQPISYVAPGDPPAFLASGDKDRLVSPGNVTRLGARLRAVGVTVEEKLYPGAGHSELVLALVPPLRLRLRVLDDASRFLMAAVGPALRVTA
ncbi:MAG: alpha/beta hydrolase [Phenylobacterium sp.]|uniref:alpha/beta hydrolase n=1 Tax=Phenylobacterium sp. TaxID=1871053 RepID=UPI0027345188|nr:alpha/beta hydrolase [Phenylobacterium sp.]MDP3172840.1 alpha/beta hydrolase [Phenylobacterium sp.]